MTRRNAGEGLIRQRPNGLWEARYVAADGRKRSLYGKTKREVTERLRDSIQDAERGIKPVDQRSTTAAYLDLWLRDHVAPSVRPRTAESYSFVVEHYLKPSLGRVRLAQLEPEHVQAYTVLRIALGRAVKLGRVHRNVATLIDVPAKVRREVMPMSADQARRFLAAVAGDGLEALYRLALTTGMRQGELLGLQWRDVNLDDGWVAVRHTLRRGDLELADPKTDSARRAVAIDDETVALLRAHRLAQLEVRLATRVWKDRDLVFARPTGEPMHARTVLGSYHKALERAGLARQPFHQLRHGFATLMLEAGEELANISKVLGHSTLTTTADFYGHLTPTISRRASDRMRGVLAG